MFFLLKDINISPLFVQDNHCGLMTAVSPDTPAQRESCVLLRLIIYLARCFSLRCAKTAERIEVLLVTETRRCGLC